jgi:hypothetical protein
VNSYSLTTFGLLVKVDNFNTDYIQVSVEIPQGDPSIMFLYGDTGEKVPSATLTVTQVN